MATIAEEQALDPEVARAEPQAAPAGDPAILGLPIFVVGSIALGLSLVGYVPDAAGGVVVPVIFAATGLGLVISTVWAATLGQTMVASIFVRLPVAYTAGVALVVLALVLRTIGVLNTDASLNKAAGYVVFLFAALGVYLFLSAAETATGGSSYPLGPALRR